MVSAGRLLKPAGAFPPGHLRLGETVGCDDVDLSGAEFAGEVGQLAPDALGNLFTTQNDAPQILATKPFFRSLEQYVINEGRHANEHVRFDFPDQPEIPVGPHHFAATCAGDKNAKRGPAEVRLPESEVWRVRKHVQDSHFTLRAANFEEPSAREGQIHQIVLCKQEWNRVRRTPRGAGHENGPKLGLKTLSHFVSTVQQRAQNRRCPSREDLLVGNQHEITRALRISRRIEQVGFGSERQPLQIVERPDNTGCDSVLLEPFAIMRRKRQDDPAQIVLQFLRLQLANDFLRQTLPVGCKPPRVHTTVPVCSRAI